MQVYRIVVAIALIFGVVAFAHFVSDDDIPESDMPDKDLSAKSWKSVHASNHDNLDRQRILAAIKKSRSRNQMEAATMLPRSQDEILRDAGPEPTYENAVRRFRAARNLWAADTTLTKAGREYRLNKLAGILFMGDAEVPKETQEDLVEQERLQEVFVDFNNDLAIINSNLELVTEDRRTRIEELVRKTLAATGS